MRLDGLIEEAEALLGRAVLRDHAGRIAMVSSFGADSAVLLSLLARVSPATPVLLNETGMLFRETLDYQRELAAELGLSNVRLVRPTRAEIAAADPAGDLHARAPDACCALRKTAPLMRALQPYSAWITGRKRFQTKARAAMPLVEVDVERRVKFNPLADWSVEDLSAYRRRFDLPPHPLVARGYASIGCQPCTTPVAVGEDPRMGRWRGEAKTECGIHISGGTVVRIPSENGA